MDRSIMRMKTINLSSNLPFPQDIMIDILHRLPLKSLLTCKCVSKQWKDLIDDPVFYKRHANSRTAFILGRGTTLSVLFLSHDEDLEMHRVPISMPTCYSRGAKLLNLGSPNETMACLASINGFFFFWNLFTGATFVIGDSPLVRLYSNSWICYGFGYDSHADDHKIFVACNYHVVEKCRGVQNAENNLFWVYSLSKKVWEQFDGFSNYAAYDLICRQYIGHSFNSVLHWVFGRRISGANSWSGHREEVIVTYDLHTGRFGEILVPKKAYRDVEARHGWSGKVSQLNGLLCYSYMMWDWELAGDWDYGGHLTHVVWVMNEYGVEDSWQKLVSFDCFPLFGEIPVLLYDAYVWDGVAPVALHESEEGRIAVLFVCNSLGKMFWYGLKEGEVRVIDEDHLLKERTLNLN